MWHPDVFGYVADPSRTGAPADGARFVLYTIDQNTFSPALPLEEIGHVDLRDLSVGDDIDIRYKFVHQPQKREALDVWD